MNPSKQLNANASSYPSIAFKKKMDNFFSNLGIAPLQLPPSANFLDGLGSATMKPAENGREYFGVTVVSY